MNGGPDRRRQFPAAAAPLFERGARILFQGDSITDMGRGRTEDPNHLLGHGYAFLIAAKESADYPERDCVFINRGVSGNESHDLLARWKSDTLELKPTVLSILIGVNDVGHAVDRHREFSIQEYSETCDRLLATAIQSLPGLRLILGQPFITPGGKTSARYGEWERAIHEMQAAVGQLAEKYHAPVVPYQNVFDQAAARAPAGHWIWDGVHPTHAGHQLMADAWRTTYIEFYGLPEDSG